MAVSVLAGSDLNSLKDIFIYNTYITIINMQTFKSVTGAQTSVSCHVSMSVNLIDASFH